jgi:hypothetical protein
MNGAGGAGSLGHLGPGTSDLKIDSLLQRLLNFDQRGWRRVVTRLYLDVRPGRFDEDLHPNGRMLGGGSFDRDDGGLNSDKLFQFCDRALDLRIKALGLLEVAVLSDDFHRVFSSPVLLLWFPDIPTRC